MDLGQKLFELRKGKNLSQEEVADKLNVTRQTVSKWETNQSTPDFDKIVPLCELFEISTEELLIGKKTEEENNTTVENNIEDEEKPMSRQEVKRKSAEVVSTSVFIYIAAVAMLIVAIPVLRIDPIVVTAVFLLAIAWATARIIKHYMSIPKFEKTEKENKEDAILKQINGIVGVICTIIYFIISFATMAWHITWIIFVIDGLICQIIKLIFMLKEEEVNEE
jgi:transcriptional regulator with XRE-family HTH domain